MNLEDGDPRDKEREKAVRALRNHYKNTFNTKSGKVVLVDLLVNEFNCFGDEIEAGDEDARVKRNIGNMLLERLGCGDRPEKTAEGIIDVVLGLPVMVENIDV